MGNRQKHRDEPTPEPTQSELWRAWAHNSLPLSEQFCTESGLERKTDVYNWLYLLGIQPDRYLIRKGSVWGTRIEIRFSHPEDLAWIRLSGMVPGN